MRRIVTRKAIGTACLMIATFLNPFGFDILVYKLTQLTNDYWSTMHVLYGLAFLSFLLSYAFFKIGKQIIGNLLMTLALFLSPLGYDIVVYGIMTLTHDYWMTMSIMYTLAATFFGIFMYLYRINPVELFKYHAKETHTKISNKIKKNDR